MGEVVSAAIVGHVPTVMLDEDIRRKLGGCGEDTTLVDGFARLREHLDEQRVDTLIIFDTHWFTTTEHVIAGAAHHKGLYTSEELPRVIHELPFDYPGAPALADNIRLVCKERRMRVTNATTPTLPRHYPTINLIHHLHRDEQVLSIGVCQTGEMTDFLDFGANIAEAISRSNARVALLGSGGMSHRFWPLSELFEHLSYAPEHVITAQARAADEFVLDCWRRGDHRGVCEFYPQYRAHAPEGKFAHYLMLLGALGGLECTAPGSLYSAYENSIGTGQVHVVFNI